MGAPPASVKSPTADKLFYEEINVMHVSKKNYPCLASLPAPPMEWLVLEQVHQNDPDPGGVV